MGGEGSAVGGVEFRRYWNNGLVLRVVADWLDFYPDHSFAQRANAGVSGSCFCEEKHGNAEAPSANHGADEFLRVERALFGNLVATLVLGKNYTPLI